MACSSCQKNKNTGVNRPRINIKPIGTGDQQQTENNTPASPKFQIPKVLPPLK